MAMETVQSLAPYFFYGLVVAACLIVLISFGWDRYAGFRTIGSPYGSDLASGVVTSGASMRHAGCRSDGPAGALSDCDNVEIATGTTIGGTPSYMAGFLGRGQELPTLFHPAGNDVRQYLYGERSAVHLSGEQQASTEEARLASLKAQLAAVQPFRGQRSSLPNEYRF